MCTILPGFYVVLGMEARASHVVGKHYQLSHTQTSVTQTLIPRSFLSVFFFFPEWSLPPPPLIYLFVCLFFETSKVSQDKPWLSWNSLCKPDCPQTHRDLPVSASQVLGLKTCVMSKAHADFQLAPSIPLSALASSASYWQIRM